MGKRLTVEPSVQMHGPVQEVLPGVYDDDGPDELQSRDEVPVDETGHGQLPAREGGCDHLRAGVEDDRFRQGRVFTTGKGSREHRMSGQILRQTNRIDAYQSQQAWKGQLGDTDAPGPDSHVVLLLTNVLGSIEIRHDQTSEGLDHLLQNDIPDDVPAGDMVPLEELRGRVQTVLREVVIDIDEVEDHGHGPVGDDWQDERQDIVRYRRQERLAGSQGVRGERWEVERKRCIGRHVDRRAECIRRQK